MLAVAQQFRKYRTVSVRKEYDFSIENLWQAISAPGNLIDNHPFCLENRPLKWGDDGHSDILTYLNGRTYVRDFTEWSPHRGYSLVIGEENGPKSHVVWRLESLSETRCSLTITVSPYLLSHWPRPLSLVPFVIYIRPQLTKYLEAVLGGFGYNLQHSSPVPRNYFGAHRWFS